MVRRTLCGLALFTFPDLFWRSFPSITQLAVHAPSSFRRLWYGVTLPARTMLSTNWLLTLPLSVSAQRTLLTETFLTLHIKPCLPVIHSAIFLFAQLIIIWKYFPARFWINSFHSHSAIRKHACFYSSFTPRSLYASWNVDSTNSCRKSNKFMKELKKGKRKARLKLRFGASLVAQWLRIRLPMRGTWVRALVWEDPTCRRATRPVSHNYWACASGACAPQQERLR